MPREILLIMLGVIIGFIIHVMLAKKEHEANPYSRSNSVDRGSLFDDAQPNNNDQLSQDLLEQVKELTMEGKKVNAIKVLREGTGWSLKESKEFVEKL